LRGYFQSEGKNPPSGGIDRVAGDFLRIEKLFLFLRFQSVKNKTIMQVLTFTSDGLVQVVNCDFRRNFYGNTMRNNYLADIAKQKAQTKQCQCCNMSNKVFGSENQHKQMVTYQSVSYQSVSFHLSLHSYKK
jgi:23S rRNA U2552 (ribose-2'-O)-methylase RlmE/FtsJ